MPQLHQPLVLPIASSIKSFVVMSLFFHGPLCTAGPLAVLPYHSHSFSRYIEQCKQITTLTFASFLEGKPDLAARRSFHAGGSYDSLGPFRHLKRHSFPAHRVYHFSSIQWPVFKVKLIFTVILTEPLVGQ